MEIEPQTSKFPSHSVDPHLASVLGVTEYLYVGHSEFQEIVVAESEHLKRILFLNGNLQLSDVDESYYHEMLVHVPINSLIEPKRILIIGGGDGGTLREVLKYPSIEEVTMIEIDREVVEVCNRLMPSCNLNGQVYQDSRVRLLFEDGIQFVRDWNVQSGLFDSILVDSSDFRGPAAGLFSEQFFSDCARILNPEGVLVAQSGSPSLHRQLVKAATTEMKKSFSHYGCFLTCVPSYLCGHFTFSWASKGLDMKHRAHEIILDNLRKNPIQTKVYNAEMHFASFALPNWFQYLIAQ